MLAQAANLIHETIGLSGVSFFDPPINSSIFSSHRNIPARTFLKKTTDRMGLPNGPQKIDQILSNIVDSTDGSTSSSIFPKEKICKVLASSTRVGSEVGDPYAYSLILPETILQSIVERFPRGGVLSFDNEGPVDQSELDLAWHKNFPEVRVYSIPNKIQQTCHTSVEESDLVEVHFLWSMLPGVRSIILFPLWNSSRDRLFAYNITWTTDINRAFNGKILYILQALVTRLCPVI